jgi:hypothetical protein
MELESAEKGILIMSKKIVNNNRKNFLSKIIPLPLAVVVNKIKLVWLYIANIWCVSAALQPHTSVI